MKIILFCLVMIISFSCSDNQKNKYLIRYKSAGELRAGMDIDKVKKIFLIASLRM